MQKNKIIIIISLLLSVACASEQAPDSNVLILGNYYDHLNWIPVDLDAVKIDTITVSRVVDFLNEENLFSAGYLERIKNIAIDENSIFVFTDDIPFIAKFTVNGKFISAPITSGSGPTELTSITNTSISIIDSLFVITDGPNGRLQFYDLDLNHINTVSGIPIDYTRSFINGIISGSSIYLPGTLGEFLVTRIDLSNNSIINSNILRSLVPPGQQPMALNFYGGSGDGAGNVYFNYKGLNYLMKFNSSDSLVATYEIKDRITSKYITDLESIQRSSTFAGVSDIITNAGFVSDNIAILATFNTISILEFNPSGAVNVKRRFTFVEDSPDNDKKSVYIQYIAYNSDKLIISSFTSTGVFQVDINSMLTN